MSSPTPEELAAWTTEASNPATEGLDAMSALEIVEVMNAEDRRVADAVAGAKTQIALAIEAIAEAFAKNGRLLYVGAGTSGRLGVLDAAECPPTFRADPERVVGILAGGPDAFLEAVEGAEDDPARGATELDAHAVNARDVVVGIAASGRTPYVLGAIDRARAAGAKTVGVACNVPSKLLEAAEIPIAIPVGPEVVAGSTRLKAGTATKMVLNMLTTGAFVRIGKTFGNRMVDVATTNEKLVARAQRLIHEIGEVERELAADLLRSADGEVKTAIAMAWTGLGPDEARAALEQHAGRLRGIRATS